MKRTMTTILFGLCLLLASCSREDTLNDVNHDGDVRQVSLNVTLPEGMTTRAVADEADPAVTRCYVQVLNEDGNRIPEYFSDVQKMTPNGDGSFSLTVALNPGGKYDFLFWADNADGNDPTSLMNVPYTADGKTIAFAARIEDWSYSQSGIQVELKHVVTRVTIVTTVATDIDDTHTLKVSVPQCYTAYNVGTMQPRTENEKTDFAYTGFQSAQANGQMGHFYLIGNSQPATLTLQYTANEMSNTAEASNVPMNPNYHITLKGAVPNIGLAEVSFTATVDSKWGTDKEQNINAGFTIDDQGTYHILNQKGLLAWNEAAQSDLSLNCTLEADINLSGIDWTPIGTYSNPYTGTFDGDGHTITRLTVTGSNEYAGLFSHIGPGGTVKNVKLEDVQIESNHSSGYVGGVAGYSYGTLENCLVSGSVSGTSYVGGVVGCQWSSPITGCSSSATVKGITNVGGVAGKINYGATLTGCYATGSVTLESSGTDNYCAGGVVGSNASSTLQACYAWGSVSGTGTGTGTLYVGGVTGTNDWGTLTGCYHATGSVAGSGSGTVYVGGVTGRNMNAGYGGGIITACYWGSNPDKGIGENQADTDGTTQVKDSNWQNAFTQMNVALNGLTTWNYGLNDEGLPELMQ